MNPNSAPTNESVAEQLQAAKELSDEELAERAAAARAAREQANAAALESQAKDAPAIDAARKAIEESFDWTGAEQDRRGLN